MSFTRHLSTVPLLLLLLPLPRVASARASVDEEVGAPRARVDELQAEVRRLSASRQAAAGGPSGEASELDRKIDALSREIERLRTGDAPAEAAPATESVHGLGPAASKVYGVRRGVS